MWTSTVETLIHAGAPSSGAAEDTYRRQRQAILNFEAAVVHDESQPSTQERATTPIKNTAPRILTPSTGRTDRSDIVQDSQVYSLPPLHLSVHAALQAVATEPSTNSPSLAQNANVSRARMWEARFAGHLYGDVPLEASRPSQALFKNPALYGKSVTPQSEEHTTPSASTQSTPEQRRKNQVSPQQKTLQPAFLEAEINSPFYCADASGMLKAPGLMLPPQLSPVRRQTLASGCTRTAQEVWRDGQVIESFSLSPPVDSHPPLFPDFLMSLPRPKPRKQGRSVEDLERGFWSISATKALSEASLTLLWSNLQACVCSASLVWVTIHRKPGHIRVYCWAGCAMPLWVLIREYCKPGKLRDIGWYDADGNLIFER